MKSIVMCCVVLICAMTMHGKVNSETAEELRLAYLKNEIGLYFEEYDDILNKTQSLIKSQLFRKRATLISKPYFDTLNQIKNETKVAEETRGTNKTHCYEAAKPNLTTARKHAFDASTACGEEYMQIIKANVTEEYKLLETACMMYLSFQKGISQTITDRLTALENVYIESIKHINTAAFEAPMGNSTELDSCLHQRTSRLTTDLQNILSHASTCISAF